ncbi:MULTISPECIES: hypothetical protein [unclassified Bacillus (in: firmicutes)]|nr:hypothetical protein [Bacillus sp. 7788]
MIQADTSGETAEWWSQWDKEDDESNRAFFHEAVPDFRLQHLLSLD